MKKCGKFGAQGGLGCSCEEALQGHGLQGFSTCPGFLDPGVHWVMLEAALLGFGCNLLLLSVEEGEFQGPQHWDRGENTPKLAGLEVKKS